MALNDPTSKMSKSLPGSYIALTESDEGIRRAIRRAVTDTGPTENGEMSPGVKNLFTLLEAFAPADVYESFLKDYHSGQLRYKDLKEALADATIATVAPIRERQQELLAKPDELKEIVIAGADRARRIAQETMQKCANAWALSGFNPCRQSARCNNLRPGFIVCHDHVGGRCVQGGGLCWAMEPNFSMPWRRCCRGKGGWFDLPFCS